MRRGVGTIGGKNQVPNSEKLGSFKTNNGFSRDSGESSSDFFKDLSHQK